MRTMVPGMCSSIAAGVSLSDPCGVRIEDIVAVTANDGRCLNNTPDEMRIIS